MQKHVIPTNASIVLFAKHKKCTLALKPLMHVVIYADIIKQANNLGAILLQVGWSCGARWSPRRSGKYGRCMGAIRRAKGSRLSGQGAWSSGMIPA